MRIIHLKISVGTVPCSIVYLLRKRPMTLSTWIRTLAIPFVVSTSTGSSCSLSLVKVATTDFALLNTTLSCIVKPQSAITMLLGTNLLKIPQFSVSRKGTSHLNFIRTITNSWKGVSVCEQQEANGDTSSNTKFRISWEGRLVQNGTLSSLFLNTLRQSQLLFYLYLINNKTCQTVKRHHKT